MTRMAKAVRQREAGGLSGLVRLLAANARFVAMFR
jgi:hypothetical protein